MLAVYFWRRIATAGHCCRIATAGDYSLLQSDHELSSIINQRAPERPSLGRGQLETGIVYFGGKVHILFRVH